MPYPPNEHKVEDLVIKNIPDSVRRSILYTVANFTVGFLRIEDTPRGKNLALLGSGTLVTVNSIHAILTAHHVLKELPRSGGLGLILSERSAAPTISTDGLRYLAIARGPVDSEGPDLGAVILSSTIASELRAKQSFHNLDIQREGLLNEPPDIKDGLWIVQGFIGERTQEQLGVDGYEKTVAFHELSSSGMVDSGYTVGNHDYFLLRVSYRGGSTMPRDFGGASGGGLWQVRLVKRKSDAEITHKRPILSGVAFYQEPIQSEETAIKCHGRRSVYEVAYEAIRSAV